MIYYLMVQISATGYKCLHKGEYNDCVNKASERACDITWMIVREQRFHFGKESFTL